MTVIERDDDEPPAEKVQRSMEAFVRREPARAAAQLIRQESDLFSANVQLQGAVDPMTHRQEVEALREALAPFLTLDRDIGNEWADVCEEARLVHEATGRQ